MRKSAVRIFFAAALAAAARAVFALPGFSPYIADQSGVYIYYRDYTFQRESYVGFLMYDAGTYAARYYAPADRKSGMPERALMLFLTLDPDADHVELTGEKIVSAPTPDSAEIVNYLHDMLYELTARRIKAGDISPATVEYSAGRNFSDSGMVRDEDFMQFGGRAAVIYDYLAPLFNVKKVECAGGSPGLTLVTAGVLQSSDDKAFENFRGFPEKKTAQKHPLPETRGKEAVVCRTADGQRISLDSSWRRPAENLWLCGDAAVLSVGLIPSSSLNGDAILRQMLMSAQDAYVNWEEIAVARDGARRRAEAVFYNPGTGAFSRSFRILEQNDGGFYFLTLAVFEDAYAANRKYFTDILESYRPER